MDYEKYEQKFRKMIEENEKNRQECIIKGVEVYMAEIDPWKYSAMEIRAHLIETKEKLAGLYLSTDNNEILEIIGDISRAIDRVARL
jgi:hypothetical protein